MFVFALISAELVLLYAVFWYLFLRDPNSDRKIVGSNWGRYENTPLPDYEPDYPVANNADCEHCGCSGNEHAVKGYMVPRPAEVFFDRKRNRFVTVRRFGQGKNRLASLIQHIDEQLSRLNVHP
jgi:hypothetical protein